MSEELSPSASGVQSPEVLLKGLNRDLLRLRAACAHLSAEDSDLESEITALLRRSLVTEVLHDSYAIAVAGMQSAGKTTFVQRLLGLDSDLLFGNLGRGERMPILITGDDAVSEPVPLSSDIIEDPDRDPLLPLTKVQRLDRAEWAKVLDGQRERSLLAQLLVPASSGLVDGRSLLLLPGYEKRRGEAVIWQDYMRQALAASAIAIVVVDQTRLANSMQDEILADLKASLVASTPIVVISKVEGLSETKRKELSEAACRVFEIPSEEESVRVIFSGSDSDPEDLRTRLDAAIGAYGYLSSEGRAQQLRALRSLLRHDLGAVFRRVEQARAATEVASSDSELAFEKALSVFDQSVERLGDEYEAALTAALNQHRLQATRRVLKAHEADIGGAKNIPKRLGRFFVESLGERDERVEGMLLQGWNSADDRNDGFVPALIDVTGQVVARRLAVEAPPKRFTPGALDDRLPALPIGANGESAILPEGVEQDLRLIAEMNRDSVQKPTKDMERAIALMPVLALDFVRTAQIAPELVAIDPANLTQQGNFDPSKSAASLAAAWSTWSVSQRALITTGATVLGLDLLADGTIDSIPTLAGAVGTALSGAGVASGVATAASVAVGAAASVVAVGALAAIAVNQVRATESREREALTATVGAISDANLAHYRDGFDDVMSGTRQVFEARLRDWLRINTDFARGQWLAKVLADTRNRSSDLLEIIDADPTNLSGPLPQTS